MSDYKFRVWEKEKGKYLEQYQLEKIYIHPTNGLIANQSGRLLIDGFIIEKYTGNKGRNNKEIYPGDRVKFDLYENMIMEAPDDMKDDPPFTDSAQISTVGEKGKIEGDFGDYDITLIEWAMERGYVFEVIGNIHENKEASNDKR